MLSGHWVPSAGSAKFALVSLIVGNGQKQKSTGMQR